jgi:hypothetical protein
LAAYTRDVSVKCPLKVEMLGLVLIAELGLSKYLTGLTWEFGEYMRASLALQLLFHAIALLPDPMT